MESFKLMQPTFFFSEVYSKTYNLYINGILKLSLLESMCDLTNTIKPPLSSIIRSIYELIILIFKLIVGKRFINVGCYSHGAQRQGSREGHSPPSFLQNNDFFMRMKFLSFYIFVNRQ